MSIFITEFCEEKQMPCCKAENGECDGDCIFDEDEDDFHPGD